MKKIYTLVMLFLCVLIFSGCDQVTSFLGDYFPSMKKEKAIQPLVPAPRVDVPAIKTDQPAEIMPNTLAQIGSWTLTIEEFNEQLAGFSEVLPEFDAADIETRAMVLEELIRQQLLVEAAEKQGIHQQKEIVDAMEEFRTTLLVQELATRLTQNIQATEQDARDFYNENMDLFREDMQWRIREILVSDENRARGILIELLQGADFASMARSHSSAPTAARGGDTGFVVEFEDPQVNNMVLTLEPGGISSVFRGQGGFYIIKLEEKLGGVAQPFEQVKDDLIEGLAMIRQQEVILDYLEELINSADIYINEDFL